MLRTVGSFGSGKKKKGKGKEGKKKRKNTKTEMEGCTDIQTRKDGRKEGAKREKRGEGGRGRKGVNRMCSAPLKGRRAQDLAVVGFTFAYRVRLHISPSLLPVSPGPC